MKFKTFTLLCLGLLSATTSNAADYYVSVNGNGTKDGSNWENAIDFETWNANIGKYKNQDAFYFQEGEYFFPFNNGQTSQIIGMGYALYGGFAKTLTGTSSISDATPSLTPTVFSGDVDRSGTPNKGDAKYLLSFKANTANGTSTNLIIINGIEFTCTYSTDASGYNNGYPRGAVYVDNSGDVKISNCKFYNNKAGSNLGGMAFTSHRSMVSLKNCEFYNNTASARGGAVKLTSDNSAKGYYTFEGCSFHDNSAGDLGSAILLQQGQTLNIFNCNISGNTGSTGGAVYAGTADGTYKRIVTVVNSTIAGNAGGPQLDVAVLKIANSVIVGDETNAAILASGTTTDMTSYGYNVIGKVSDATIADLTNGLNMVSDEITSTTDLPYGATAEELASIKTDMGLDASIDLNVFQNGDARGALAVPGAEAAEAATGSFAIDATATDGASNYATYFNSLGWIVPENLTAAIVTSTSGDAVNLDYKYNSGDVVPSGTAVLVKGSAANYTPSLKLSASSTDTNLLQGSDVTVTPTEENKVYYKLSLNEASAANSVGFYWGAANGAAFESAAHKAYLAVAKSSNAKRALMFSTTTGIQNAVLEFDNLDAPAYNLAGQKVGKDYRGIVIKNGRKYINK